MGFRRGSSPWETAFQLPLLSILRPPRITLREASGLRSTTTILFSRSKGNVLVFKSSCLYRGTGRNVHVARSGHRYRHAVFRRKSRRRLYHSQLGLSAVPFQRRRCADIDFTRHFGAEAEFHFAKDSSGSGQYEKTYEIGGRYFRTYGRFVPYAKVLWGRGVYNFTQPYVGSNGSLNFLPVANLAYNLVAAGAGADYKLQRHFYVRGDWEYQRWFSFQGSSLSPNLITVGLAYHFR
jgi:hypothetical protein